MFHKYFNDASAIGPCFTSSPSDQFSVSVQRSCFTLVSNGLMEGVSIIHGLFDYVSQVEHGILQPFHKFTMHPSSV
jgi:hypothetical protein